MTASFPSFEEDLKKAIADGVLPGAVVAARDKSGKINYLTATGSSHLTPSGAPLTPLSPHTIFPLASMTKLITCIAACQLIDRGLITPDTDVTPLLPELAALPILKSFSADPSTGEINEVTVPRTNPILFRHLLTHSSGLGYPFLDPLLKARAETLTAQGKPLAPGPSVPERYGAHPLLFEPGENWSYGSGIDWAGHLVELLTGQDLESYVKEHILRPLNLPDPEKQIITFYPERLGEEVQKRQMQMTFKTPDSGGKVIPFEDPIPLYNQDPQRAVYGGEAGHADLTAYIEILNSLLVDDERLLKKQTAELLFKPMLKEEGAKKGLLEVLKDPGWIVGWIPDTGEYNHSLGGVLVDFDEKEGKTKSGNTNRRRGFLMWGGMFNLSWFIDREAGVTALFGTSVLNPADPDIEKLFVELEEAVYAEAGAA
ncbi:acyltransferase LovD [Naviculisporaceae sp. PSN 640]